MDSHESAASDDANQPANADDDTDITEGMAVTRGRRWVAPVRPPEALHAYVAPRVKRRRRSDWPVLLIALIVAALVMAGCCIAGFALYTTKGSPFK
jgi:acyl dehydratase